MIEKEPGADWRDLQQRVAAILVECGLVAEVGRSLGLARGTVEIDVYATDPTTTPRAMYLCECKRWRSRVPQAEVQAFRTVVSDAGAHFGLFVSAAGFQAGAFEVVRHTDVHLLGSRIVGALTLVVFRIPTGIRAWIEDVVVDETMRGRGVCEAMSQEAVSRAVALGARTVELTSRPSPEAANRLYQRLGFTLRDSNVYRYIPKSPQSEHRAATQESEMIRAVDIKAELAGRPVLSGRDKDTTEAEAKEAFAALAPFRDGSIFAGSFSGESPWERHRKGDELVHILAGAATLTIMTDTGPQSFAMTAGMLIVVPQGHWHRFHAPDGVTVLTATPQPTDHTAAADPRTVA